MCNVTAGKPPPRFELRFLEIYRQGTAEKNYLLLKEESFHTIRFEDGFEMTDRSNISYNITPEFVPFAFSEKLNKAPEEYKLITANDEFIAWQTASTTDMFEEEEGIEIVSPWETFHNRLTRRDLILTSRKLRSKWSCKIAYTEESFEDYYKKKQLEKQGIDDKYNRTLDEFISSQSNAF